MEFPPGIHHYFQQKVCTFHYWFLYVNPKKGWEEYLKFAKTDGGSAGYVLTFPPESVVKAVGMPATEVPAPAQSPPQPAAQPAPAEPAPKPQQTPP